MKIFNKPCWNIVLFDPYYYSILKIQYTWNELWCIIFKNFIYATSASVWLFLFCLFLCCNWLIVRKCWRQDFSISLLSLLSCYKLFIMFHDHVKSTWHKYYTRRNDLHLQVHLSCNSCLQRRLGIVLKYQSSSECNFPLCTAEGLCKKFNIVSYATFPPVILGTQSQET